jgi:flagellar basal-body rod protein FlgF
MQHVLAIALNSLQQDMQRLDRVALNIANVATPGYKREVAAARPFVEVVDQLAASAEAAQGFAEPSAGADVSSLKVLYDIRPGTLRMTGEPLDLALTGEGFFEVATPEGPAYTRQGNFQVDARGRLVTAQGYPVLGRNGDIYLTTLRPVIDAAGNITEPLATEGASAQAPGMPVAQLKVVRFEDANAMRRLGDGLLAPGTGATVAGEAETHMRQGALENANVSTIQEMVQLMQTMRHAESMQKVASGYDEMVGTAIRKLGDLS